MLFRTIRTDSKFTIQKTFAACVALLFAHSASSSFADVVTSTATARIGSDLSEVSQTQTDAFGNLSVLSTGTQGGVDLLSSIDASFTSADAFQVDVAHRWDFRNISETGTYGFGATFEYEFEADGTAITIVGSNVAINPLFSGASTFGGQDYRWRLIDLTTPNGFVALDFGGNGTQSFTTIVGHDYLLRLSENSSVAAGIGSSNLGLNHTGTFNVSVPAKFTSVPEPGNLAILLGAFSIFTTRRCRTRELC